MVLIYPPTKIEGVCAVVTAKRPPRSVEPSEGLSIPNKNEREGLHGGNSHKAVDKVENHYVPISAYDEHLVENVVVE